MAAARAADNSAPAFPAANFLVSDCNGTFSNTSFTNTVNPTVQLAVVDNPGTGLASGLRIGLSTATGDGFVALGTVLLLDFNETAGNYADHSTAGNTGTRNGTTSPVGQAGFGNAAGFTGAIGEEVLIPASGSLASTTNQFTLQAWVNWAAADAATTSRPLMEFNDTVSSGTGVWINNPAGGGSASLFADFVDTPTFTHHTLQTPNGVLGQGAWHLVTVTYDGLRGNIFVDKVLQSSATVGSFSNAVNMPLHVGRRPFAAVGSFNGGLDQVRVLTRALSSFEVREDVYSGEFQFTTAGSTGPFTVTQLASGDYTPAAANGTLAFSTVTRTGLTLVAGNSNWMRWFVSDRAGNAAGFVANITVSATPPSAPAFTVFHASSPTSLEYNWTAPGGICTAAQQYDITDCSGGLVSTVIGPPVLTIEPGLAVNSLYGRQVRARDVNGIGPFSSCSRTYTAANPPGAWNSSNISTGSMSLSWGAAGNPTYTRYEVGQWSSNFTVFVTSPIVVAQDYTGSTFPVSGLQPSTTYFWRVRAFNGSAFDSFGSTFTVTVDTVIPTLAEPPAFTTGTALGFDMVRWNWTPQPTALDYILKDGAGATLVQGPALTFTQSGLTANTRARTQVFVHNQSGVSAGSPFIDVFTLANAPTATAVASVTSATVTLGWTSANPGSTNFEVVVATDAGFGGLVSTRSAGGASLVVNGLLPATTYFFHARALNGDNIPTAFDGPVSTRTDIAPFVSQSASPPTVYVTTDNAVGIWHFDVNAGTVARDSSGQGNDGALTCFFAGCVSTPTFAAAANPDVRASTDPLNGLGNAIRLTGFQDSISSVPHTPSLNGSGALTVEAWINPSAALQISSAAVIAKGDGGVETFALDIIASAGTGLRRARFFVRDALGPAGQWSAYSTQTIRVNAWQHVVGVYDPAAAAGSRVQIYIDGALSAAAAGPPGPRLTNAHILSIGARQSGSAAYDLAYSGLVDEIRLLDRALTAAQVAADYQAGLPAPLTQAPPNQGLQYLIPPNAFGGPVTIYVSMDPLTSPILASPVTLANGLSNPPTGQALVPGSLFEIVPVMGGLPFTGPLGSSVTLSIPYADADGNGIVDGTLPPIPASGVRLYTLNTTVVRWEPLTSSVDTGARRVTGLTPHFSVFALFGPSGIAPGVSGIRVYPVPWKPQSGGSFDSVTFGGRTGLAFDTLPSQGDIRIYTLAGELVKAIAFTPSDAGTVIWDGKNGSGRNVASGVYFAYVKSGAGSTILKFAVER